MTLTMKKPQYIGALAQIMAAQAEAELRDAAYAERKAAGRAAVGKAYLGKEVSIIRVAGLRHVLLDAVEGIEIEMKAVIRYAGNDGAIVIQAA